MTWVIEKIATDDASTMEVEWDTWNIGIVEDDRFRAVYSCFSEADAIRLKTALEWFEQFEKGTVRPAVIPAKKRPVAKKPVAKRAGRK